MSRSTWEKVFVLSNTSERVLFVVAAKETKQKSLECKTLAWKFIHVNQRPGSLKYAKFKLSTLGFTGIIGT